MFQRLAMLKDKELKMALHHYTPLLHSHVLTRLVGTQIYLKCESMQPSGSFKDRGIGHLCEYYAKQKVKGFVSSSGGNAGLAVAYASQALKIPAKVIVPLITPEMMISKLKSEGATVIVTGENWNAANEVAKEVAEQEGYAYIPPFDHPIIWEGYTSLVRELQADNIKPDAIILSVGGGGLLSGILQGLYEIGWQDVKIITAETEGAASFAKAMKANKRIILDKIDTVAVTLGAKQICQQAFDWSQKHPIFPEVVSDKEAVQACLNLADDHHLLVEPACGAALAVVYQHRKIIDQFKSVLVILCGGSGVSLQLLETWKRQFGC